MRARLDSIQEAATPPWSASELDGLYWAELARMLRGLVRKRGDELRFLGVWPALMRFGPLDGGVREIRGGLLVAEPGGTLRFEHEDGVTRVVVRGFVPRLPRTLYVLQSRAHVALGKRFLRRLGR